MCWLRVLGLLVRAMRGRVFLSTRCIDFSRHSRTWLWSSDCLNLVKILTLVRLLAEWQASPGPTGNHPGVADILHLLLGHECSRHRHLRSTIYMLVYQANKGLRAATRCRTAECWDRGRRSEIRCKRRRAGYGKLPPRCAAPLLMCPTYLLEFHRSSAC